MATIYPVIMCGGSGTRMWPLSRKSKPKQFLKLTSQATLLEETVARSDAAGDALKIEAPILICGAEHAQDALRQSANGGHPASAAIVEPFAKNTAAAAAIAALHVKAIDPAGFVLLLPADHHMAAPEMLWSGVEKGLAAAEQGKLVTLGIEPEGPETGYGYINTGAALSEDVYEVAAFKEKPDIETARSYIAQGDYYWNAGIFLYCAESMIQEFEALGPDILQACRASLDAAAQAGDEIRLDEEAFRACRSEPVDTEIMERTSRAAIVAPVRPEWNDIGSWTALAELLEERAKSGSPAVQPNIFSIDCKGGLVRSDGPFVAALGLSDIVVVATGDAVLVAHKDYAQKVKSVVEHLKEKGRDDLL